MDKIELLELIDKDESTFTEFKADAPVEVTPVPRSKPDDLNKTLLVEYFRQVRDIGYDDNSKWLRLLSE